MPRRVVVLVVLALAASACGQPAPPPSAAPAPATVVPGSFGDDLAFLRAHTSLVVLTSADGRAQVAVAPDYQGRVMTSTADGLSGASFGYVHRPGVSAGTKQPHMTVLGGEDRFWLGPEGGQYALFFPPGAAFDNEHWQTPEPIDWGGWPVVSQQPQAVTFKKAMTVTSHAGTTFDLRVDRTVRLLDAVALSTILQETSTTGLQLVAYESENTITNTGKAPWTRAGGLVSIWILGQMKPSAQTTIVVPFVPGTEAAKGPIVNDKYFGAIPPDRLKVGDGVLFFRGDGNQRGKIGVPRPRARDIAGSYDAAGHVLTLVQFAVPEDARDYVNSMWETQKQPYGGDVVNSYNDGPLGPGQPPLGPFYEIESSSPAAALAPGASLTHAHRTVHLQGGDADLDRVARAVLGVSIEQIVSALPSAK